jgi:PAS domain S-box-containing protein
MGPQLEPDQPRAGPSLLALLLLLACILFFLAGLLPALDFTYASLVIPGACLAAVLLYALLIRPLMTGLAERAYIEDSLRRRARETEDLYDKAPCGYLSLGPNGKLLRVNDTALEWLGYRREELLGRSFSSLLDADAQEEFSLAFLAFVCGGGEARDMELTLVRKDGSTLPVLMGSAAVVAPDGTFLYTRSTFIDITERQAAARRLYDLNVRLRSALAASNEASERLRMTMAAARIGTWELDVTTGWVDWSDNVRELLNLPPGEPRGTFSEFLSSVHPDDRAAAEALGFPDPYTVVYRVLLAGGGTRWLEGKGRVFHDRDGRPLRVTGTVMDVTPQKEASAQLRLARDEAESANRAKSDFLATMSHEIRTPLAGILGMAEILGRTDLDSSQRRHLTSLTRAAEGLLGLINGILDLSKVESGRMELERIPLRLEELAADVCGVLAPEATRKGLRLQWAPDPGLPPRVLGDPSRLRQVLLNLLGNAVKFTERGEVTLSARPLEGGQVELKVQDTGVGIPANRLSKIFDPFAQASASTARTHGGTGLGLAISARLVEIMGGKLEVASEVGKGSTFWFAIPLPVAEALPPTPPEAPRPTGSRASLKVLVAEDNPVNRDVLLLMLQEMGCEAVVVADGAEAVEQMRAAEFDAVLMDVQMPGMDGLRATRLIRAREKGRGKRTPIIAVTANAMQGERERCLGAGMDGYLTKPVRPEELAAVLQRPGLGTPGAAPEEAPNWMAGLASMGLGPEAIRRLARTFLDTVPPRLETLRESARSGDPSRLAQTAHSLKATLGAFGLREAADVLAAVEEKVRCGEPCGVPEIHRVEEMAAPLLHSLADYLGG